MVELNLREYLIRQREWSSKTFGPGLRTVGITRHIEKELIEIRTQPLDLEEWVDVMILALDGFWRAGGHPDDLAYYLEMKQRKNFERVWPAPQAEDQPTEHVRDNDSLSPAERKALADSFVKALEEMT